MPPSRTHGRGNCRPVGTRCGLRPSRRRADRHRASRPWSCSTPSRSRQLPPAFARCPTIYVGEPRSHPFEQARMNGRARLYLSYEESATRLRDLLPLVEELAEKQALVELLTEKNRRAEPVRAVPRAAADAAELWDFLEGAMENLDSRERLVAEFRRASRHLLRASHAVFFLRDADHVSRGSRPADLRRRRSAGGIFRGAPGGDRWDALGQSVGSARRTRGAQPSRAVGCAVAGAGPRQRPVARFDRAWCAG